MIAAPKYGSLWKSHGKDSLVCRTRFPWREAVALTDAQKAELDRRLDAHRKHPTAGASWSVVRDRIGKRK